MRVTKYVDVETEVEVVVEIGADDIAKALSKTGAKDSVVAFKTAANNFYAFLNAVPDETVAELETKYFQPVITFFEAQRARFQAELDKRPQVEIVETGSVFLSYCRFENTLDDLRDCYEALDEPESELSERERKCRAKLIKLCHDIANEWEIED